MFFPGGGFIFTRLTLVCFFVLLVIFTRGLKQEETAENVNITRVPAKVGSFPVRIATHGVAAVTDVAT